MTDFEKVIQEMRKSGMTRKDIFDQLRDTMTNMDKSDANEAKCKWQACAEKDFFEQWEKNKQDVDPKFIIKLLIAVCSKKHSDWTTETMANYTNALEHFVTNIEKVDFKSSQDIFNAALDEAAKTLKEVLDAKQKAKEQDSKKTGEKKPKISIYDLSPDAQAIASFFDLFGL